jgi:hypothetical protein
LQYNYYYLQHQKSFLNQLQQQLYQIEEQKKKVESNVDSKYEKATQINTQEVNYENLEKREK